MHCIYLIAGFGLCTEMIVLLCKPQVDLCDTGIFAQFPVTILCAIQKYCFVLRTKRGNIRSHI